LGLRDSRALLNTKMDKYNEEHIIRFREFKQPNCLILKKKFTTEVYSVKKSSQISKPLS
jgi:hypothetical protein